MTFLPIAERELRVIARRKATYWSRLGVAGAAFIIFAGVIAIFELGSARIGFGNQMGPILFGIFSWLSFAFVCSAGVFLTSDSLSEEKREGTLGLLFLTDLRGYDVVIGKLLSTSLTAAYGLMAAFPVIGISFLIGGVTGAQFWRLALVLFNTLFFSLSIGVFISAISRDAQRAMNGTVLLCALFLAGWPALDWALAGWDNAKFAPLFSLASPGFTFTQTDQTRLGDFWTSLVVTHVMSWLFLAVACVIAPRTWQETASVKGSGANTRAQRGRFGSPAKRAALRQLWLAENPIRWLAARDLWLGKFQWLVLLGGGVLFALLCLNTSEWQPLISVANGIVGLLMLLVHLWVASHASRFFVDAMRSGTIELLLATPLQPRQIVLGQLWALRRTFARPVLVLMLLTAVLSVGQIEAVRQAMAKSNAAMGPEIIIMQIVQAFSSLITLATGLIATAWFGMWMGLTSKKANVAVIKTIVFVQVIPLIALWFITMLIYLGVGFVMSGQWFNWLPQTLITILAVAADVAFILVSRKKLLTLFRELASGDQPARPKEAHRPWSPEWETQEASAPPSPPPGPTPPPLR